MIDFGLWTPLIRAPHDCYPLLLIVVRKKNQIYVLLLYIKKKKKNDINRKKNCSYYRGNVFIFINIYCFYGNFRKNYLLLKKNHRWKNIIQKVHLHFYTAPSKNYAFAHFFFKENDYSKFISRSINTEFN